MDYIETFPPHLASCWCWVTVSVGGRWEAGGEGGWGVPQALCALKGMLCSAGTP